MLKLFSSASGNNLAGAQGAIARYLRRHQRTDGEIPRHHLLLGYVRDRIGQYLSTEKAIDRDSPLVEWERSELDGDKVVSITAFENCFRLDDRFNGAAPSRLSSFFASHVEGYRAQLMRMRAAGMPAIYSVPLETAKPGTAGVIMQEQARDAEIQSYATQLLDEAPPEAAPLLDCVLGLREHPEKIPESEGFLAAPLGLLIKAWNPVAPLHCPYGQQKRLEEKNVAPEEPDDSELRSAITEKFGLVGKRVISILDLRLPIKSPDMNTEYLDKALGSLVATGQGDLAVNFYDAVRRLDDYRGAKREILPPSVDELERLYGATMPHAA